MNGVEFFSAGLKSVSLNLPPVSEGVCPIHNGPAELYNFGDSLACRGCILLRQTYPVVLKNNQLGRTRLSLGCYMLITERSTHYWGNHRMPPEIIVHPATGAMRAFARDLILNPPQPPWMFVAFARANAPDRLVVTVTNDLMRFSGDFFLPGATKQARVTGLNRKRVMALHTAADLTWQEWERVVRSHAALSALSGSTDALAYLRGIYDRFPKLAKVTIPAERSPEYNAVRLIARDA